jgi:hypothetical protein
VRFFLVRIAALRVAAQESALPIIVTYEVLSFAAAGQAYTTMVREPGVVKEEDRGAARDVGSLRKNNTNINGRKDR